MGEAVFGSTPKISSSVHNFTAQLNPPYHSWHATITWEIRGTSKEACDVNIILILSAFQMQSQGGADCGALERCSSVPASGQLIRASMITRKASHKF